MCGFHADQVNGVILIFHLLTLVYTGFFQPEAHRILLSFPAFLPFPCWAWLGHHILYGGTEKQELGESPTAQLRGLYTNRNLHPGQKPHRWIWGQNAYVDILQSYKLHTWLKGMEAKKVTGTHPPSFWLVCPSSQRQSCCGAAQPGGETCYLW